MRREFQQYQPIGIGAVAALAVEAAERAHLLDYVWTHLPGGIHLASGFHHLPAGAFLGVGLVWAMLQHVRRRRQSHARSDHAKAVVVRERTTVTTTTVVERELVVTKQGS
jgi:hypothetical protein